MSNHILPSWNHQLSHWLQGPSTPNLGTLFRYVTVENRVLQSVKGTWMCWNYLSKFMCGLHMYEPFSRRRVCSLFYILRCAQNFKKVKDHYCRIPSLCLYNVAKSLYAIICIQKGWSSFYLEHGTIPSTPTAQDKMGPFLRTKVHIVSLAPCLLFLTLTSPEKTTINISIVLYGFWSTTKYII